MKKLSLHLLLAFWSLNFFAQNVIQDLPLNNIYYREKVENEYMNSKCLLDIYIPENTNNFPIIVWYHGGGLTGGSKHIPERLKNKGFAVVAIGYRLSPEAMTPEIIDDAAAGLAWVFNNISNYGGDVSKIFVSGHSAGGYLTLMLGYDKSYLNKYGIDTNKIAALIPYSPQVITHFTNRKERGISEMQPIIDKYAPLYYVSANVPPTLLITGDREEELFGRYEENAYLWRMLKLVGHPSIEICELDGFNHGDMVNPGHDLAIKYINNHIINKR